MVESCPLMLGTMEACKKPSNKSPKIAPFCCYMHRDEQVRREHRKNEERLISNLAKEGQLVDNQGRICRVDTVRTREQINPNRKKGHRHKSGIFETVWVTRCDEYVSYPYATTAPAITCMICLVKDDTDER